MDHLAQISEPVLCFGATSLSRSMARNTALRHCSLTCTDLRPWTTLLDTKPATL